MEKETASVASDMASTQKSLPSSYDPGWNDPPKWAVSTECTSASTSTKRLLNKRVAFPWSPQSSATGTAEPPATSNMPPVSPSSLTITTAPHKPLVTPNSKDFTVKSLEAFDKNQALVEVMDNLESAITKQSMDKSKVEEVQKRLNIMKSDWLEDKLNDNIRRSILDMSKGSDAVPAIRILYYSFFIGSDIYIYFFFFQHC